MPDDLADNYIDRLLSERKDALAQAPQPAKPTLPPEQKRELAELGVTEDEPFVVELVEKYGKIPTEVLDEMTRRKLRWGF